MDQEKLDRLMKIGADAFECLREMTRPLIEDCWEIAFQETDAPGKVTVISNWIPLQNPAGGPYFGKLDPEAHYYVKIDNTGDGVEDISYRWRFKNTFRQPDSFLYAIPPVNSINDRKSDVNGATGSGFLVRDFVSMNNTRNRSAISARSRCDVSVSKLSVHMSPTRVLSNAVPRMGR